MLKKRNNILVILFMLVSMFSCIKDEGISDSEQAKIDNEILIDYLETHYLKITETNPDNNINWEIVEEAEGDDKLLSSIAILDSVTTSGIVYYYWYIEVSKGGNIEIDTKDLMVVDYNEFLLDGTVLSSTSDNDSSIDLEIKTRIKGVQYGLELFLTGIIPEDGEGDYRENTELPGKGILIIPSGLGYQDLGSDKISPNQPLRVDIVLYDKIDFPEEE